MTNELDFRHSVLRALPKIEKGFVLALLKNTSVVQIPTSVVLAQHLLLFDEVYGTDSNIVSITNSQLSNYFLS